MPVSFNCECGKALRVKDEFAGKKVKCPACSRVIITPEITSEDLMATEGLVEPKALQAQAKCQTCGAELKVDEPVCMKCGTIRQVANTQAKTQSPADAPRFNFSGANKPFHLKPVNWAAGLVLMICVVFIYKYVNQAEDEPPANNRVIAVKTVSSQDQAGKPVAVEKPTPEKLLAAELQNKDSTGLDKTVEHILKLRAKSVPVLMAGVINNDRLVKLKSLSGLYILAYFKCYRSEIQAVVRDTARRGVSADEELNRVALETLYLLATDQPDPAFLEFADMAGKYTEQFSSVEKSPAVGYAKDVIVKQFTQNSSGLIKVKAFAYLVLLGDKWNIKQVVAQLKNASGGAVTFTRNALVELTGCSFEKQEDWDKWYAANKNFSSTQWLIGSLESAPEPQRQKTIQKLMRLTGQNFLYPADGTDEDQKAVIAKWQEFGKTLK